MIIETKEDSDKNEDSRERTLNIASGQKTTKDYSLTLPKSAVSLSQFTHS